MAVTRGAPLHPPSYSTQARTRRVRVVQTQRRHEYTALVAVYILTTDTRVRTTYARSQWSDYPMSYLA